MSMSDNSLARPSKTWHRLVSYATQQPEQEILVLLQANSQEPNSGEQGWRPIGTAPVNTPVLVRVAGQSEPVVAIRDEDRCWQVAWTGDLLPRPILWQPIPGSTG